MELREQIHAAMTGEAAEPVVAPEPVQAVAATPPEAEAVAAEPTPEIEAKPPGAADRDDKGRFAPKEPKAAETPQLEVKPEPVEPVAAAPQETETTRVPPSLSAAVKAQWNELPPEVRKDISRLEETVQTAKAEWGKKGERLNRYDEIMAPRNEKLQLQGIDEFTAIKTLFAAQDFLERDPMGGIAYLARSYGVTPQQMAQAFGLTQASAPQPGAEGHVAPTAQPDMSAALQPYLQRVQTLEQQLQTYTQGTEAEKLASARAEVADFASKPENMYFENVRPDVVKRLESGAATTLADAYEQATWASPEIRPLLLKAQSADAAKQSAQTAARQKSESAARSSGSVTGAPSPGAVASRPGSTGNLRADLEAARQAVSAQI